MSVYAVKHILNHAVYLKTVVSVHLYLADAYHGAYRVDLVAICIDGRNECVKIGGIKIPKLRIGYSKSLFEAVIRRSVKGASIRRSLGYGYTISINNSAYKIYTLCGRMFITHVGFDIYACYLCADRGVVNKYTTSCNYILIAGIGDMYTVGDGHCYVTVNTAKVGEVKRIGIFSGGNGGIIFAVCIDNNNVFGCTVADSYVTYIYNKRKITSVIGCISRLFGKLGGHFYTVYPDVRSTHHAFKVYEYLLSCVIFGNREMLDVHCITHIYSALSTVGVLFKTH